MKTLKINNEKIITKNFHGISYIHQLYEYMPDKYGRNLTDEQIEFKVGIMKKMGIKYIRSFYGSSLAYDGETGTYDFENEYMQAFYKACKKMEEAGITVGITPQWSMSGLISRSDKSQNGWKININYNGCYVEGDENATAENFANFVRDSVLAFKRHGINNIKHLFCFTECNNSFIRWGIDDGKTARQKREYDKVCRYFDLFVSAVDKGLKDAGLREEYKIVGPCDNWRADDGSEPYSILVKYCVEHLADKIDIIGSHNGYDRSHKWTDPDFYDLPQWKLQDPRDKAKSAGKEYFVDEFNVTLHTLNNALQSMGALDEPMKGVALGALTNKVMNMGGINTFYLWALFDILWPDHIHHDDPSKGEFYLGVQYGGYLRNVRESRVPYKSWYSAAMLTKHLGEGNVFECEVAKNTFVSAMERYDGETVIVLTNYENEKTDVEINLAKSLGGKTLYKYVYNPETVVADERAEQISCSETKENVTDKITDKLPGYCVVVYTTAKPKQ